MLVPTGDYNSVGHPNLSNSTGLGGNKGQSSPIYVEALPFICDIFFKNV
jgi:hypothetical protein